MDDGAHAHDEHELVDLGEHFGLEILRPRRSFAAALIGTKSYVSEGQTPDLAVSIAAAHFPDRSFGQVQRFGRYVRERLGLLPGQRGLVVTGKDEEGKPLPDSREKCGELGKIEREERLQPAGEPADFLAGVDDGAVLTF